MLAAKIRKLASKKGHGLKYFWMVDHLCAYYWDNSSSYDSTTKTWVKPFSTQQEWSKACKLLNRYHRYVNYVEEVVRQWVVISTSRYADNSIEVTERSKDGTTRRRMTQAPG